SCPGDRAMRAVERVVQARPAARDPFWSLGARRPGLERPRRTGAVHRGSRPPKRFERERVMTDDTPGTQRACVFGLEEELHTIWRESDRAAAMRAEDRERRFRRLQDLFTVRGSTPREHLRRLADIFSVQPGFFERFLQALREMVPA